MSAVAISPAETPTLTTAPEVRVRSLSDERVKELENQFSVVGDSSSRRRVVSGSGRSSGIGSQSSSERSSSSSFGNDLVSLTAQQYDICFKQVGSGAIKSNQGTAQQSSSGWRQYCSALISKRASSSRLTDTQQQLQVCSGGSKPKITSFTSFRKKQSSTGINSSSLDRRLSSGRRTSPDSATGNRLNSILSYCIVNPLTNNDSKHRHFHQQPQQHHRRARGASISCISALRATKSTPNHSLTASQVAHKFASKLTGGLTAAPTPLSAATLSATPGKGSSGGCRRNLSKPRQVNTVKNWLNQKSTKHSLKGLSESSSSSSTSSSSSGVSSAKSSSSSKSAVLISTVKRELRKLVRNFDH